MDLSKITRVEVIDHTNIRDCNARKFIKYGRFKVEIQIQDLGLTMKVFISEVTDEK